MDQYNVALRLKYEQTCLDCGESDFVEDHASGDLICRVSPFPLVLGMVSLMRSIYTHDA